MKKTVLSKKNYLVLFCILHSLMCFGQGTFEYKCILRDSITQEPLTNVKIYLNKDSVGIYNKNDGSFLINVKEGDILLLRKKGYRWENIKITANNLINLEMVPSTRFRANLKFDEIVIDGKILPKDEWDDINPCLFGEILINIINGKTVLIVKLKMICT